MRNFLTNPLIRVVPVALVLAYSGCVTSSPYQTDAAHPIQTITISRDVSMPQNMTFSGFSQMMAGMLFGVAGVLATVFREGGDYHVPEMVRDELTTALTKTGKFKIISSGQADAEVQIRVREYGFVQGGFMQRRVKPILTMETLMVRRDGTQIWKSGVAINQKTDGTPSILPEELKANPKLAADSLHTAARIWAAKTAESLK